MNSSKTDKEELKKSQQIWQIHILFQQRFECVPSFHFQALMMKTFRYKYYNKRITTRGSGNDEFYDQEERKLNSTINVNSGLFFRNGSMKWERVFSHKHLVAIMLFWTYLFSLNYRCCWKIITKFVEWWKQQNFKRKQNLNRKSNDGDNSKRLRESSLDDFIVNATNTDFLLNLWSQKSV